MWSSLGVPAILHLSKALVSNFQSTLTTVILTSRVPNRPPLVLCTCKYYPACSMLLDIDTGSAVDSAMLTQTKHAQTTIKFHRQDLFFQFKSDLLTLEHLLQPWLSLFGPCACALQLFQARALYDFQSQEDNEVSFKAGEVVNVLDNRCIHVICNSYVHVLFLKQS